MEYETVEQAEKAVSQFIICIVTRTSCYIHGFKFYMFEFWTGCWSKWWRKLEKWSSSATALKADGISVFISFLYSSFVLCEKLWFSSSVKVQYWLSLFQGKYGHQTKGWQLDNVDVHGEEEDANNTYDTGNDKQSKVTTQHSDQHDEFEVSFLFLSWDVTLL